MKWHKNQKVTWQDYKVRIIRILSKGQIKIEITTTWKPIVDEKELIKGWK